MRAEMSATKAMAAVLIAASFSACAPTAESGAAAENGRAGERYSYQDWPTGPYQVVENWPKPLPDTRHSHDGWTWGSFAAVFAESPDRIWVAMRGEQPLPEGQKPWTPYAPPNPNGPSAARQDVPARERRFEHVLYVLDGDGNLVDEWPQHDKLFAQPPGGRGPHAIKMNPYDPDKHVWVVDDQLHMIYKFSYTGELVKSFGTLGVRGRGPNTFDRPTDIAWLPDGTWFVSDGYGGTRVAKFDANDTFIMDWGEAPKDPRNPGPNEFNTVHSIQVSNDRRVYVLDRGHARMQVFDENGKFLDMWPLTSPHWPARQNTLMVNHIITTDQYIWVGDAPTSRLLKFDLEGNHLYSWGAPGPEPGRLNCPHGITTDQRGNLYIAECTPGRVQKFTPLPGADPAKLVGQILRYPVAQ